ncbi:MAG TPA: two-component regulator propeller domain-containing protein, partial [Bacteroidales bacterium]
MKRTILFVILIWSHLLIGMAQQDRFYTPYQGLSNTSFNCIAQDNDGFLWIATNGGLNKFDGYNFVAYQHNPADTNSLDLAAVYTVFVDSKGKIWVGTERRLFVYNKKLDNFSRYPIRLQNKDILPQINAILEDNSKNLWLMTSYG